MFRCAALRTTTKHKQNAVEEEVPGCADESGLGFFVRGLAGSAKEEGVAVGVAEFEPAQAVVGIAQGVAEDYFAGGELGGQRIGIFDIDECVQAQVWMARWVWLGRNASFGFDEDLRAVTAHDGEEGILGRVLEARLEAELVAVDGYGLRYGADDEGWGDMAEFGTSHLG